MKVFYRKNGEEEFTLTGGVQRDGFKTEPYYNLNMKEKDDFGFVELEFNTRNPMMLRQIAEDMLEAANELEKG